MNRTAATRRHVLRGLGVSLSLPFLGSLAPRRAGAATAPRRWIVVFFPNGTPDFWTPTGTGANWQLSPILEPLAPFKSATTVLSNIENYSPFGTRPSVEPSHSQLAGAFLTCNKCHPDQKVLRNAVSADQLVARALAAPTVLPSLQVGLSTRLAYWDERHPANSRSISWASATEPLYKTVNPQAFFDSLVNGGADDDLGRRRRLLKKSALDYVADHARSLQRRLGADDRVRLDQFLASVRDIELRVSAVSSSMATSCDLGARPKDAFGTNITPPGYSRDAHADIMIDLIGRAVECDLTRVITLMLDDERSEYAYQFLPLRHFTKTSSTVSTEFVKGTYHDLQHTTDTDPGYASITRWNVEKLARLCQRLDAIKEPGGSALNNSVVSFGSSMHSGNHAGDRIPTLYVGSGGGVLKTNQHIVFPSDQRLSDVYLTIMKQVFGMQIESFANSKGILPQLLV